MALFKDAHRDVGPFFAALLLMLGGCSEQTSAHNSERREVSGVHPAIMPVGTNLDGLAYWNPGLAVLDVMKASGRWLPQTEAEYDTGEPILLDAHGWVRRLPARHSDGRYTSVLVNVLHDNPAAVPQARYVVMFAGKGTLAAVAVGGSTMVSTAPGRLVVQAASNGGVYLRITALNLGDPLRDIRVVREDRLALYEAGLTFNPDFVDKLRGFHVLRFMDWMQTNMLFDKTGRALAGDRAIDAAPLLDWRHRPTPGDHRWGDGSRGMPVEALVEIANRAGAEPWFNMPVNADDGYIRAFADYVHANLRSDLRVRVELSNEVWNRAFPQARYAETQARLAFGPNASWMAWYAMRAVQVGKIWKTAFAQLPRRQKGGRVRLVYNTQFAWRGLEGEGLDVPLGHDPAGRPLCAFDWFDDYAITGYYDGTMNTDDAVPRVHRWWQDADGGYARAVATLSRRIEDFNAPLYAYHSEQARRRGLALITYESGFGEYTPPSQHGNDSYTTFLRRLQRRPEFYDLETQNYRAFQHAGGVLFMNFGLIATPSKWGNWAALETVGETTSPRYQALVDWIAANPSNRTGARIYQAGNAGETLQGSPGGYDVLVGGTGDDRFVPRGGTKARMVGGGGDDVLILSASRAAYRIVDMPGGAVVSGPDGSETITGILRISFANASPVPLVEVVERSR